MTFTDRTPSGVTEVTDVACSSNTTWIIADGKIYGCGENDSGQQSSGDTTDVLTFTDRTPSGVTEVTDVVCSFLYNNGGTTWILTDGKVYGCGKGNSGQQGSGGTSNVTTFTNRTPNGITAVTDVACSAGATWIIADGKVYGCGSGNTYQQSSGSTSNVKSFTQRGPPGSINIPTQLSPQNFTPIHLDPLNPLTPHINPLNPVPMQFIDYTAITGFDTWQMGGEDWMLATVTVGVDQYALALYYAGLTEPLVWDEDVHMVFDNGTLTVTNNGTSYTMDYTSIYYRGQGDYVLASNGYLRADSQFLAYATPTADSGALVKGTMTDNDLVSIADGSITLDDVVITSSEVEGYPGLSTMSAVTVQYDTDQTSTATSVILPKNVTVTISEDDEMYSTILDAIIIFVIVAILMGVIGLFAYTRS